MFNDFNCVGTIDCRVFRRPGPQRIDISITHAEDRRNQNGVVDLEIRRSPIARCRHILGSDMLSAQLDFSRNIQKSFRLGRPLRLGPSCNASTYRWRPALIRLTEDAKLVVIDNISAINY